jgi:aldose 1-epimerase
MNKRLWGKADGRDIWLVSMSNGILKADVTNYGAAVVSLRVPGRDGELVDVVMGFDSLAEYIDQKYYVGVTIGRCANRIKHGRFTLNGEEFLLDRNEGENHLH